MDEIKNIEFISSETILITYLNSTTKAITVKTFVPETPAPTYQEIILPLGKAVILKGE